MEGIFPEAIDEFYEEEFLNTLRQWNEARRGKSIWLFLENGCVDLLAKVSKIRVEEQVIYVWTQEQVASGSEGLYILIHLPQKPDIASFEKTIGPGGDENIWMRYLISSSVSLRRQQESRILFSLSATQPDFSNSSDRIQ